MTVQYLQGLNIFVITYNCNPVCSGVSYEASDFMLSVSLLSQQGHLWPLEKP
jgi:hypothetical protein